MLLYWTRCVVTGHDKWRGNLPPLSLPRSHVFIHQTPVPLLHSEKTDRQCSLLIKMCLLKSDGQGSSPISATCMTNVLGWDNHLCVPHSSHLWNKMITALTSEGWCEDYMRCFRQSTRNVSYCLQIPETTQGTGIQMWKGWCLPSSCSQNPGGDRHVPTTDECCARSKQRGNGNLREESGNTPWRRCCLKPYKSTTRGGKEHDKLRDEHVDWHG